jgi:hypothetical protein
VTISVVRDYLTPRPWKEQAMPYYCSMHHHCLVPPCALVRFRLLTLHYSRLWIAAELSSPSVVVVDEIGTSKGGIVFSSALGDELFDTTAGGLADASFGGEGAQAQRKPRWRRLSRHLHENHGRFSPKCILYDHANHKDCPSGVIFSINFQFQMNS